LPATARVGLYELAAGNTRWSSRPTRDTLDQSQFVDQLVF
jgi:hypothetical protein